MQNEFALPFYLQQHEVTKTQLKKFFSKTKCRRITTNDKESIPLWVDPQYLQRSH